MLLEGDVGDIGKRRDVGEEGEGEKKKKEQKKKREQSSEQSGDWNEKRVIMKSLTKAFGLLGQIAHLISPSEQVDT